MMRPLTFWTFWFFLLCTQAHGRDVQECSVQRGSQVQYWAWREVDGRKCWYVGRPGKPKNELYWRGNEATPVHRAESSVPTPPLAPPDTTPPPLPSREELMARAEAALRLLGGERLREEEPAKPVVERVPPPPPPKQVRERLPVWAMALLVITCIGAGFLFPIALWRRKHG